MHKYKNCIDIKESIIHSSFYIIFMIPKKIYIYLLQIITYKIKQQLHVYRKYFTLGYIYAVIYKTSLYYSTMYTLYLLILSYSLIGI